MLKVQSFPSEPQPHPRDFHCERKKKFDMEEENRERQRENVSEGNGERSRKKKRNEKSLDMKVWWKSSSYRPDEGYVKGWWIFQTLFNLWTFPLFSAIGTWKFHSWKVDNRQREREAKQQQNLQEKRRIDAKISSTPSRGKVGKFSRNFLRSLSASTHAGSVYGE